ncbi:ATP-binding protein [Nocardioides marmotae]|uniref:sensor histidine kinase n=1 Tax=Nocardioides marmotae TaxID=2663857 RepID=UPI0012B5980F|nr:ATP-binding protein [Nocardioides marmotae]MBC9733487.1 Spo0B domain-containing protein [Nocardioides marmotae]MTB84594.1 GHKL domain-containing protein [Nocardioides marmotae]
MWSPARPRGSSGPGGRRWHLSLAGQFLALQLLVLLVVVLVSGVVSVRQAEATFRDDRGARLRSAAEGLAGTDAVQAGLAGGAKRDTLEFYAQQRAGDVGASAVHLADPSGRVLVSTDPTREGQRLDLGPGDVLERRSWTGDVDEAGERAIAAQVPVLSIGSETDPPVGDLVGIVVVAEDYPPWPERLRGTLGDLVTYLTLGLTLGVAGSFLLSRLIKRRTRGLEPSEIAALADQREALLTSLREGVVAVGESGVLTLVSDSARELLGLPTDAGGRRVADLDLEPAVRDLLTGTGEVHDQVLVMAGRVLVTNRSRVRHGGRATGTVTTVRDRTELLALQSELSARQSVTETLRAQTHEFSNQLHTISGLLQLGEHDEAARLISTLSRRRAAISDAVTSRVEDPAVAALLIAKTSSAAERRTRLDLTDDTRLPRLDHELSADLGTVLGNLVDNAVEAVAGTSREGRPACVDVRLVVEADGTAVVQVSDTGPGVPPDQVDAVFRRGFTTKPSDAGGRGIGLALVQVVCERRGGSVSVHGREDGSGAVFTARLPAGRSEHA